MYQTVERLEKDYVSWSLSYMIYISNVHQLKRALFAPSFFPRSDKSHFIFVYESEVVLYLLFGISERKRDAIYIACALTASICTSTATNDIMECIINLLVAQLKY